MSEGVQVIGKAIELVAALGAGPKSVAELAGTLGLPRSTIYRILRTLVAQGWVDETERRSHFRVGVDLIPIARSAIDNSPIRMVALPFMRSLRNRTGLDILLTVPRGLSAVCIERLSGPEQSPGGVYIGTALPLHAGAAPRLYLAYGGEPTVQAWESQARRRGQARPLTPRTMIDIREIKERLPRIRARGYELSHSDTVVGYSGLAAPIFGANGHCVAALSYAGTIERITEGHESGTLAPLVIDACKAISQRLKADAERSPRTRSRVARDTARARWVAGEEP